MRQEIGYESNQEISYIFPLETYSIEILKKKYLF